MPGIGHYDQGAQSNKPVAGLLLDLAGIGQRIIGEKFCPVSAKGNGLLVQIRTKAKSPLDKRAPNSGCGGRI
jgi:hypothetical protein